MKTIRFFFLRSLSVAGGKERCPIIYHLSRGWRGTNDDEDNLQTATSSIDPSFVKLFSLRSLILLGGIPASTISISSLGSSPLSSSSPLNLSALIEFEKDLNVQAGLREYLTGCLANLPTQGLRSIQIQSTSLAQLTQSTNQLTRTVLVRRFVAFSILRNLFH